MANSFRDWEDIGDNVQRIVEQAINSQDYQQLNQTVRQIVGRAMDIGSDALRRAVEADRTAQRARVQRTPPAQKARPVIVDAAPDTDLPVLYKDTTGKMLGGIFKTIGGAVLSVCGGITVLALLLVNAVMGGSLLSMAGVISALGFGGGLFLLGNGVSTITRLKRFEKYVKLLGQKTHLNLNKMAQMLGKDVPALKKDLRRMMKDGLFLEGHFDAEQTCLITSNETYRLYEDSRKLLEQQMEQRRLEEQARTVKRNTNPQVQEVLDRGNAFLTQIRCCNDAIPGEKISAKISRMEHIVQRIFERAEAHPEIIPDLKKMMDYYLPMTVKLLNAYAEMDAQPVQGETILSSKQEIDGTLDTLNYAFEKLLDSVFRDTALDISSDISVLQTLLAQEGLTEDDFKH